VPPKFKEEAEGQGSIVAPGQTENNLAAITQTGGWKSTRMPMHYAEKINAARSGMARAVAASGAGFA